MTTATRGYRRILREIKFMVMFLDTKPDEAIQNLRSPSYFPTLSHGQPTRRGLKMNHVATNFVRLYPRIVRSGHWRFWVAANFFFSKDKYSEESRAHFCTSTLTFCSLSSAKETQDIRRNCWKCNITWNIAIQHQGLPLSLCAIRKPVTNRQSIQIRGNAFLLIIAKEA